MTRHLLRRAVAAALVVAACGVGVVLPATPALSAACSSASGITVVVDPHGLGGGLQVVCDTGGAAKAATLFTRNGFDLTYVQRQPGFVCRVDGAPASDPCVNTPPADAYWGLFWSDGTTGTWSYATTGAGSLSIPAGGYVAFSWQGSTTKALPGVAPTAHASASPSPSPSPSASHSGGGGKGSGSGSGGGATPSADVSTAGSSSPSAATGSASASASHRRSKHASASPDAAVAGSASPLAAAAVSDTTEPTAAETDETQRTGLPGWVVPAVLVLLAGSAGGVALVRRTRGAPPP